MGMLSYGGYPLDDFRWGTGPPWFILWLLNFTIIYAVIAQFAAPVKMNMPHPVIPLLFGAFLSAAFYGVAVGVPQEWQYLGNMVKWWYVIGLYIPFFTAGIIAGRNDWMKSVEEMETWIVWMLRTIVVGFWILIFCTVGGWLSFIPNFNVFMTANSLIPPAYAVPMTLALIQFFHQYFNGTPPSKIAKNAGAAAYTVYIIHPLIYNVWIIAFIAILKAAGVSIWWSQQQTNGDPFTIYYLTIDPATGEPTMLPDGYIWAGWLWTLILSQLTMWPLALYMRQLPVLNKIL